MKLNEQVLVSYEAVSAIGSSLDLSKMMIHFFKVFSRKTGAIVGSYWSSTDSLIKPLIIYGKKSYEDIIKPHFFDDSYHYKMEYLEEFDKYLLYVEVENDWIVFLYNTNEEELKTVVNIMKSFEKKLFNAITACKNHEILLEINKNLQKKIDDEIAKSQEKDKMMFQQSRQAQMGEMISMIAHQWRQPLSAISTVATAMKLKIILEKFDLTQENGREEQKDYLNESLSKVESYIQFLTSTIDDFRNFFKPDKAKEEVNLSNLVDKTLEIIGTALEVNGIDVKLEYGDTKPILTYSNELTQVILNLLKNSEDIVKEKKLEDAKIIIRTYSANEYQRIEIEDNAGGVPEEIIDRIFEPYFSTKSEKNGTGYGLYMSKTIVEEHCRGRLTVKNTKNGAIFTIDVRS